MGERCCLLYAPRIIALRRTAVDRSISSQCAPSKKSAENYRHVAAIVRNLIPNGGSLARPKGFEPLTP